MIWGQGTEKGGQETGDRSCETECRGRGQGTETKTGNSGREARNRRRETGDIGCETRNRDVRLGTADGR